VDWAWNSPRVGVEELKWTVQVCFYTLGTLHSQDKKEKIENLGRVDN
jgi:hypothetical protein